MGGNSEIFRIRFFQLPNSIFSKYSCSLPFLLSNKHFTTNKDLFASIQISLICNRVLSLITSFNLYFLLVTVLFLLPVICLMNNGTLRRTIVDSMLQVVLKRERFILQISGIVKMGSGDECPPRCTKVLLPATGVLTKQGILFYHLRRYALKPIHLQRIKQCGSFARICFNHF